MHAAIEKHTPDLKIFLDKYQASKHFHLNECGL